MTALYTLLRFLFPFAGFLFLLVPALAQTKINNGIVSGKIIDGKTREPLEYAVASLLNGADSSVVDNAVTGKTGEFTFYRVKGGDYLLKISFLGYRPLRKRVSITPQAVNVQVGALELEQSPISLKEVAVKADAPPVVVKQDTIEFNAGSFKTRENATTEDLLKKLPGVTVDKDGNIKANGEDVKKVYVDGREFFGNDPKIATRNLPANIIDKVQVIDKKSDQAEFTKIDDGVRDKVLNLTIKEDKKVGLFGNAAVGGGNDNFALTNATRFDGNLNVNRFNGNQQLSLLMNGNNTNKSNFSLQDLSALSGNQQLGGAGGGAGGGMRIVTSAAGGGGGSSNGLDAPAPPGNGITTAGSGGLNYHDNWGKHIDLNGSYFYNYSLAENLVDNDRTNLLDGGNTYYNTRTGLENTRKNHRLNLNLDWKPNSLNAVNFSPALSYNANDQLQHSGFESLGANFQRINDGSRRNQTAFAAPAFNSNLLWKHSFMKRGRTLSLNLASAVNSSLSEAFNLTTTAYYTAPIPPERIDQHVDQESRVNNQTLRGSFTEPLSRQNFLEVNYTYAYNHNTADRETWNFNTATSLYDLIDPALSTLYLNTQTVNQLGANIRTVKKKWNYTLGLSLQRTTLDGQASNLPAAIDRNFYAVLPNANLNYQFNQNKRFSANYRASVRQPSISQLQPIPDNSNPLNIRNGNPGLRPEYNNALNMNFSQYSLASRKSIFTSLMVQQISNRIASKVDIDRTTGRRITTPVNVDGNWLAFGNVSLGVPITEWKTSFNLNTSVNARRDVNFSNSDRNVTNTMTLTQGINWSHATADTWDVYLNLSASYTRTGYSLAGLTDLNYYDYRASTDFNYNFSSGFKAGFDLEYVANTGRGDDFNRSILLAGTSVQKELLNKKASVKLSVNDLFNQNLNVTRNVTENSIEDMRTNSIRRYFLLGFTYRFNKFSGTPVRG